MPTDAAIDERFIYKVHFRDKKTGRLNPVRMLNADGHIDYAHKKGLVSLTTEVISRWAENEGKSNETRWCIAMATAVVMGDKGGTVTCTGISCVNDRDKAVKQPGYEVEVAETRAKKRALADAANITERLISPEGKTPTRETVDQDLESGDEIDEPERKIPQEVRKQAPVIVAPDGLKPTTDQFDL